MPGVIPRIGVDAIVGDVPACVQGDSGAIDCRQAVGIDREGGARRTGSAITRSIAVCVVTVGAGSSDTDLGLQPANLVVSVGPGTDPVFQVA